MSDVVGAAPAVPTNSTAMELLPCEEDFFRDNKSGRCVPRCGIWSEYSTVDLVTTDAIILLTAVIGFIASVAVIVISLMRYKRM